MYTFVVSIVLFSVGGLFALSEAYHKWHETHADSGFDPFRSRWWRVPVVVLSVAIVLESFSFRTAPRRSARSYLRLPGVGLMLLTAPPSTSTGGTAE